MNDEGDLTLGPHGDVLERGRRMTYRQARAWARRADTALGLRPCGGPVQWLNDDDRAQLVASMRRAEGSDCTSTGDVLFYRDVRGEALLVIERP